MSYDAGESRAVIDVWSRLMAIGSLVLAGATLYRSYVQSQDDPTAANSLKTEILTEVKDNVGSQLAAFQKDLSTRQREDYDLLRNDLLAHLKEQINTAARVANQPPAVPNLLADSSKPPSHFS